MLRSFGKYLSVLSKYQKSARKKEFPKHALQSGWMGKNSVQKSRNCEWHPATKVLLSPELITKRNALIAGTNVHDERHEKAFEREQKNNGSLQGVHAIQFRVEYGPFIKAFELSEGILFT